MGHSENQGHLDRNRELKTNDEPTSGKDVSLVMISGRFIVRKVILIDLVRLIGCDVRLW